MSMPATNKMTDLGKNIRKYFFYHFETVKTQFSFDMENRVRTICADMLHSLHSTQSQHSREIKTFLVMVENCNKRVTEVNQHLEREHKLKDVVADLK